MSGMPWTSYEDSLVRTARTQGDAFMLLRLAGYKRTRAAVWTRFRKLKGKQ